MTDSIINNMSNVLYVDLTNEKSKVVQRQELYDKYLGGTGVATQLLHEEFTEIKDALDPEAPIVLSIGPFSGIYPCCTKAVAMFRSPLTGELGESYSGGRIATVMRFAGYDSIVITGKAKHPVYLSIHDGNVDFKDATSIWGLSSTVDVGKILRDIEPYTGRRSIIRIGSAGENGVKYANVNVDTYRHFGRLGIGAVFGSKNLKAVVISGNEELQVTDKKEYNNEYKELYNKVVNTDLMEKYHDLGTTENINVLNELNALPTRNFQQTFFECAENVSGENFGDNYLIRKLSCTGCPIGCIHVAMLKKLFSNAHDIEVSDIPYDYELVYALGTNLGLTKPKDVLELIDSCEHYGVDVISMGVVLAWATEMSMKRKISTDETMGVSLRWGDATNYLRAIDLIIKSPNEFYSALAEGVTIASEKYGGKDFAMQLGGLEVPGYHTGLGNVVGLTVGVRHSHHDNAGYSADQKSFKNGLSDEDIIDQLISEDDKRGVLNSLVICLFARKVYTPESIVNALKPLGIEKSEEELDRIGKEIFMKKYELKRKFGFNLDNLKLPGRFFETASTNGIIDESRVENAIKIYKSKRGF
ncbi:MAG: aldehyde ferredoxin oxidoreductase family protein [Methanohalobium sp.]|uniref:aldehyde ferredoxin oxidoreductase family protein n=1 Tax=Methanohalobium sp. TaxID=2837493 RepID=UPI00397B32BD